MLTIFDLDNCIASDSWRLGMIKKDAKTAEEMYMEYHTLCAFDRPHNLDVVREHRDAGRGILIVTARPEIMRAVTDHWLFLHGISYDLMLMRPALDHSHSAQLKINLLHNANIDISDIWCAYDDRQDVLDAYTGLGIDARQLYIHETQK